MIAALSAGGTAYTWLLLAVLAWCAGIAYWVVALWRRGHGGELPDPGGVVTFLVIENDQTEPRSWMLLDTCRPLDERVRAAFVDRDEAERTARLFAEEQTS